MNTTIPARRTFTALDVFRTPKLSTANDHRVAISG
jgi:hypothetical protein